MKLGKYILGLALIAVGLTSCDQDNVSAIYGGSAKPNLTFQSMSIERETEGTTITVPVIVERTYSTDAYSTTVDVSYESDKLKLRSNQVSFDSKEQKDTLYIDATNLDWGDECVCRLMLNEADVQGASEFAKPIQEVVVTVKKPSLVPAGTCTIIDYTWFEDPVTVEDVPIINVEGTNKYRIISPLYYLYKDYLEEGEEVDMSNFQFNLLDDGTVTVDDGFNLNWWGYRGYYNATNYGSYCYVERDGDSYTINELLYEEASGDLYLGGMFTFIWDKPEPAE